MTRSEPKEEGSMGIFARILQDILVAHQESDYSHLGGVAPRTDPIWHPLRRCAIAPEVISRLKEAANSDEKRATLNPDDLEYVADQLHFTPEELARLRAALLAQGVEIFLRDRMAPGDERVTVEIASHLYNRLLAQYEPVYEKVRGETAVDPRSPVEVIEAALALADRAGAMLQAAERARAGNRMVEMRFWQKTSLAAYEEIARLIRPIEPTLASDFDTITEKLRAG
jgi:hypothetical protein